MTLAVSLGRIDDIQQRLRTLSADSAAGASTAGSSTSGAGSSTAGAFAAAVHDAGAVGATPPLAAGSVDGDDVVEQAMSYLGVPYVCAGEDRSGMDCSGLVQRVFADLGIEVPRVVQDQADIGVEVPSLADAQPGDLLVTKGEGHIVIYAGDGMVIHAPSPGKVVEHRDSWLKDGDLATIRRIVPASTTALAAAGVTAALTSGSLATAGSASGALTPGSTPVAVSAAGSALFANPSRIAVASTIPPGAGPDPAWSGEVTSSRDSAPPTGVASPLAPTAVVAGLTASAAAAGHAATLRTATPVGEGASRAASTDTAVPPAAESLAGSAAGVGSTTAPTVTPAAAPVATTAASAARAPLAPQLTTPVVSLAHAGDGEHTLTVRVSPDDLGPITVKAHISGSAVSIELASGTAAGRDALRAILSDLRRDLAVLMPHSSLAVATADAGRADASSSGSAGSSPWSGSAGSGGAGSGAGGNSGSGTAASSLPGDRVVADSDPRAAPTAPAPATAAPARGATSIDVFA